jgi:hypothetical protein
MAVASVVATGWNRLHPNPVEGEQARAARHALNQQRSRICSPPDVIARSEHGCVDVRDSEGNLLPIGIDSSHVAAAEFDELPAAMPATRRRRNPIRLSIARPLGHTIDGAWWPRAEHIDPELAQLVTILTPLLGNIRTINVNWSSLQRPPALNWPGWENKRQHVITVIGATGRANILVIPCATGRPLAVMVMRRAARMPIAPDDRGKATFATAGAILRAAAQQGEPTRPEAAR